MVIIKLQLQNGKIWELGEIEDERDIPKIEEILSKNPIDFLNLLPIYLKDKDMFKTSYIEPSLVTAVILQKDKVMRVWEVSRNG